ncbi:hypothetical protein E2C01_040340 [Portunus trituberculatus]|uniref:Uncharacterized protein n=1 Tax=Portunus trituberculatus TaxID=210409 RepID=A0A5B7FNY9_PORTR|nr:hypothetical protein [Portunus trituberculatus]
MAIFGHWGGCWGLQGSIQMPLPPALVCLWWGWAERGWGKLLQEAGGDGDGVAGRRWDSLSSWGDDAPRTPLLILRPAPTPDPSPSPGPAPALLASLGCSTPAAPPSRRPETPLAPRCPGAGRAACAGGGAGEGVRRSARVRGERGACLMDRGWPTLPWSGQSDGATCNIRQGVEEAGKGVVVQGHARTGCGRAGWAGVGETMQSPTAMTAQTRPGKKSLCSEMLCSHISYFQRPQCWLG